MNINWKLLAMILSIVTGSLIAGGCSSNSSDNAITPGGTEEQTENLEDAYGGFLAVSEDPAFGDLELASSVNEEENQADGYEGLSEEDRALAEEAEGDSDDQAWYSVTITWGRFDRDSNTSISDDPIVEDIDWSGNVALSDGVLRLLSLIKFERPEDDLIRPRPSAAELAWVSRTHGGHDGIRVFAIMPIEESGNEEATLTINTAQTDPITFTRSELEDLDQITDVGPDGLQISMRAFRVVQNASLRGYCGGHWGWADADTLGHFKGRWIEENGRTMGFMRGHYGLNKEGEPVFFGKYIGKEGEFRGFLRGTYSTIQTGEETSANQGVVGEFQGRWLDSHGDALGRVWGTWICRESGGGRFDGRWSGSTILP